MGYREVRDLPIKAFWLMNSMINRVMAEKDLRALTVAEAVAVAGEHGEQVKEKLVQEMGVMVKRDPLTEERDPNAATLLGFLATTFRPKE